MNIVIASTFPEKLLPSLKRYDDFFFFTDDTKSNITVDFVERSQIQLIVAFGYGRIFPKAVIEKVTAVNLHGGLLPWNRGPNPNLWSWIDDTPKGVTIHEVDAGIDTGRIIAQQELFMKAESETLQSSYDKVVSALVGLFERHWPQIRAGIYDLKRQSGNGTHHKLRDQAPFQTVLENNLEMSIPNLRGLIRPYLSRSRTPSASNKDLA